MNTHPPLRILLVEDSPLDTFLLRERLSDFLSESTPLLHAERMKDALRLLRENSADVILCDLNLPDSFGPETVRVLVRHAGGIPIIALIGDSKSDIAPQLHQAGADAHLLKRDINTPLLVELIEQTVHRFD